MKGRARMASAWVRAFNRSLRAMTRATPAKGLAARAAPAIGPGDWIPGLSMGPTGARRFRLYRPPDLQAGERLPLLVMLHGCGQDATGFADSTRMNALARRERFLVLYPEQDRLASAQRCWNWYDTRTGRANGEVALIMSAIDQVCLLHPVDRARIALVGLSAGASMAALLATRHPGRFRALVMHSGIAPGVADSTASALAAMRGHRLPSPREPGSAQVAEHWPPLLVIQGGSDPVVSSRNGPAVAQVWADGVGATGGALRPVQRGQRYPMNVTDFKQGGRTVITLVDVTRLGHAWSGGAASLPFSDDRGPDASRMAWAFVARQFRHTAPAERRAMTA